jgi:coproporphyrinogen III oxidase-like Fe-S oxidoreductase
MKRDNIKFLQKNLFKIINAVYDNNEIWFRVYPLPQKDYLKNNVSAREINKIDNKKEFVLYIHVPFCENRCDYCQHHGSCDINEIGSKMYVNCLKKELENILKINNKRKILSMLIGGGTPTLLAPNDFKSLMDYIRENFVLPGNAQLSLEAAPADITDKMAAAVAHGGITRVCLGVQTFNEKKLKFCNRRFQKNIDVYNAVKNLRRAGLKNIIFDLIYGLEFKESAEDFLDDNLEHILKLRPAGIDIYPLQHYQKFPRLVYAFPSDNLRIINRTIAFKLDQSVNRFDDNLSKIEIKKYSVNNLPPPTVSHYWFLRRYLLKDVVSIGLGGGGDFWIEGKYIKKFNRNTTGHGRGNLMGYKQDIESNCNHITYNYRSLSEEQSLRSYVIHNLYPFPYGSIGGIYESVIREKFSKSMDLFHNMINGIRDVLNFSNGIISLKDDYETILPFKTKNRDVNYFVFSFCYLYSELDQEILLKSLKGSR